MSEETIDNESNISDTLAEIVIVKKCIKKIDRERIHEFLLTNNEFLERANAIKLLELKASTKLSKTVAVAQELVEKNLGLKASVSMIRNKLIKISQLQKS